MDGDNGTVAQLNVLNANKIEEGKHQDVHSEEVEMGSAQSREQIIHPLDPAFGICLVNSQ
jgi:hypothetical protein